VNISPKTHGEEEQDWRRVVVVRPGYAAVDKRKRRPLKGPSQCAALCEVAQAGNENESLRDWGTGGHDMGKIRQEPGRTARAWWNKRRHLQPAVRSSKSTGTKMWGRGRELK
jgi:hypothetical protein